MDKATTALMATEDNAAAIRALSNSLRAQIDKNAADIAELEDKIGTGGGSDDIEEVRTKTQKNAADIAELNSKVKTNTSAIKELDGKVDANTSAIDVLEGKVDKLTPYRLIASKTLLGMVSFGSIMSDGYTCVIITFEGTSRRSITYGNTTIGTMSSPAIFILPQGNTNLALTGTAAATALILPGVTIAS